MYSQSSPQFIATSATIANPKELAEHLTGEPFEVVDENGAPASRRHIVFVNSTVTFMCFQDIRCMAPMESGFYMARKNGSMNCLPTREEGIWLLPAVTLLLGGREGSRKGRFWTYIGQQYPYSVYDFTESRARDGPARFLAGFRGYLHADAYSGYDHIYLGSNETVIEVACWAHARRKFCDAARSSPRESHQIASRTTWPS